MKNPFDDIPRPQPPVQRGILLVKKNSHLDILEINCKNVILNCTKKVKISFHWLLLLPAITVNGK